jgi:putative two-component system response regulator
VVTFFSAERCIVQESMQGSGVHSGFAASGTLPETETALRYVQADTHILPRAQGCEEEQRQRLAQSIQMELGEGGSEVAALELVLGIGQRDPEQVFHDLAQTIQQRDPLTFEHCQRVARLAERLARRMGWSPYEAHRLGLAALVHDLGKTWIGNDILFKESALSEAERLKMERHPVMGARVLVGYDLDPFFIEVVLHHHEAYDGSGYPWRLRGEEIPLGARMLSVADVYDALTSARPYKEALLPEAARQYVLDESGRHFDPRVVRGFVSILEPEADSAITRTLRVLPQMLSGQAEGTSAPRGRSRSGPLAPTGS